ncbi:MAG TPA: response regulator [bacterium]|nr:response regulator [bacterium]
MKYSILIIDDDEFLLDMYSLKFQQSDFDVEIAFGGVNALEKIRNGLRPDIIIFDLIMPNMDGFGFLENLKKEHLAEKSKLVILSNLGQKEDIRKGLKMGVHDYIVKAFFTPSEVVNKIINLLKEKK